MRNLAIILPLKFKLSGKFQYFNAINGSIEMLKNSWISKKFELNENLKNKSTTPKQRASLRKSSRFPPSPPHQIKSYYIFGTKIFLFRYTEIYKHLLSKCFKNAVLGCQKMVQRKCSSDTKQKHVCWKICTVIKVFGRVRKYIIFNVKWVEVLKMSEAFWANSYCKISDLYR